MNPDENKSPLSTERKIQIVSGLDFWYLEPIPELDLASVMITDGPHGLRIQGKADDRKGTPATCFPTASALASSWDLELVESVGEAIGLEAVTFDVGVVLGPGINIKRHPLGGRNFEYFSEDPHLTGQMSIAIIDGIQSQGVGTSLKHLAANNQESARMAVDTIVDERALREIYLSAFEKAIRTSSPWTVMCAYNRLNGEYCSENQWLLTQVLRDEWGFDGLVVTDWGATNDRAAGIAAGLDLEMPGSGSVNNAVITSALASGDLSEAALDAAASRVTELTRASNKAIARDASFDIDDHHQLARQAAAKCCVLLTNDGVLPLPETPDLAVIGEFAMLPRFQGAGSSEVVPTKVSTIMDGIAQLTNTEVSAVDSPIRYARGYDLNNDEVDQSLIDEAVLIARSAKTAVVVVGLPDLYESEGFDRDHMRMPAQHNALVNAVCSANPNTVVVLCNGSALQIPWVDKPRAVLEAHLGGQAGGLGVADVLFGAVNPSGKLSETFALRQTDHASDSFFPGTGRQVQYRESLFVGYRWFDHAKLDVLFPFGHGLSYTTFEYSQPSVSGDANADDLDMTLTLDIPITNSGSVAGAEIVQLYIKRPDSEIMRAEQTLAAFAKVELQPDETKVVSLTLDRRSFAHYDVASSQWTVEDGSATLVVGASSRDERQAITIDIISSTVLGPPLAKRSVPLSKSDFASLLGHAVPDVEPVRPITLNTRIAELGETKLGVLLHKLMVDQASKQFASTEPTVLKLIDRMVGEATIRSAVLLSGGILQWRTVERMIALANRVGRSGK